MPSLPSPDPGPGKVLSVAEAVRRFVADGGGSLAVGGMHMHNNPMALVREVVRQGGRIPRLITSPSACLNADLLIAAGLVEELVSSYVGFEHLGLAPCFRRAVESGALRILEVDEPTICHGLYAAAGGLPFVPLPPGLELTDLSKVNRTCYRTVADPFTGREVLAVMPLRPDVALLHAAEADARGNAFLAGAPFTDRLMAFAARRVIVQAERLVPRERIAARPPGSTIPGFLVHAVVEAPGGCHPTASHGEYGYDEEELRAFLAAAREPEGTTDYIRRRVRDVSETEYLEYAQRRVAGLRDAVAAEGRGTV